MPSTSHSTSQGNALPADHATHGDRSLFAQHKTAFFCSRNYSAAAVLPAYDWARKARDAELCVISGFHSRLEQDVLDFLLAGTQPVIMVVARSIPKRFPPPIKQAIDADRMLIVSPFQPEVKRITQQTARQRNEFIAATADALVVGHANPGSHLQQILNAAHQKPVQYLYQT